MARLIDAYAAAEAVCYNCMDKYDCQDRCSDYMEVFNIPTVDAVPVVRCRNCDGWESKRGKYGLCEYFNKHTYHDDFCSYGEKRGDSQ